MSWNKNSYNFLVEHKNDSELFAENVFIIFLVGRDDDDVENDIEKNKIQVLIIKKSKNLFMDDKSCKNFIFS